MRTVLLAFLVAAATRLALAIEIYGTEAKVSPDTIFAGQIFEFRIDVAASQNGNLSIGAPLGLPDAIRIDEARPSAIKTREGEDGRTEYVHSFVLRARADSPLSFRGRNAQVVARVTERVQSLFGTSTSTRSGAIPVLLPSFEVLALPEEGCPRDFCGAVGSFRLVADVEPAVLMPGDIAKFTLSLKGDGNPGDAEISLPELPAALFKVYPPEALPPADGEFARITASIIPLSTQSVEVAAAKFSYFDPVAGRYKVAESKPLSFTFRERKASAEPAVRTIDIGGAKVGGTEASAGLVQLFIAPSPSSFKTFLVSSAEECVVLETTPDGKWERVKIPSTGRTGWREK